VALVGAGADVRDVCPTRPRRRRQPPGRGKSDRVDAEAVACELLAHPARSFLQVAAVATVDDLAITHTDDVPGTPAPRRGIHQLAPHPYAVTPKWTSLQRPRPQTSGGGGDWRAQTG